jgi:hypothetical protein
VLDFTSIATLFAFVLVCGGVLLIAKENSQKISSSLYQWQFIFPVIVAGAI